LLGAVTYFAVALACLLDPWRSWCPALVLTGTLLMMLLAVPAGIYTRKRARAYYVGFATVGWGYFFLAYAPWFEANVGPQLLAWPVAESVCIAVTGSFGDFEQFLKVTHVLFMLGLALLGGLTASRLYVTESEPLPEGAGDRSSPAISRPNASVRPKELCLRRAQ